MPGPHPTPFPPPLVPKGTSAVVGYHIYPAAGVYAFTAQGTSAIAWVRPGSGGGAGGGGGGSDNANNTAGAGGGGGGAGSGAVTEFVPGLGWTKGDTITVTVGVGGPGGAGGIGMTFGGGAATDGGVGTAGLLSNVVNTPPAEPLVTTYIRANYLGGGAAGIHGTTGGGGGGVGGAGNNNPWGSRSATHGLRTGGPGGGTSLPGGNVGLVALTALSYSVSGFMQLWSPNSPNFCNQSNGGAAGANGAGGYGGGGGGGAGGHMQPGDEYREFGQGPIGVVGGGTGGLVAEI